MDKLNLAVFFGGRSAEHDVSIVSALQAMENIPRDAYNVTAVYIARDGAWYTGHVLEKLDTLRAFKPEMSGVTRVYPDVTSGSGALLAIEPKKGLFGADKLTVVARIDVAMPIFHGLGGEDGSIQGLFELMNVPYTSSGLVASSVGMDKIAMRALFRGMGFPLLTDTAFTRGQWAKDRERVLSDIEKALPYPMFVKPANLGSSIGISRADDRAGLQKACEIALSYDRRVLVEQGLEKPMEVNCAVLGFDQDVTASLLEMPVTWETFLTFDEKYLRGDKDGMQSLARRIPAPISEAMTARVQTLACDIFRALDCKGTVRIDFFVDGDSIFVGEINTIPGSLAFYLWQATGMPYPKLIDKLVEYALLAHAEKQKSVFAFDSKLLQKATLGGKGKFAKG